MRIQDMERKSGLDRATIRFYEREGLLNPARKENGYRDYSEEDADQLLKIKLLRQLGMSVEQIRKIQQGSDAFPQALQDQIETLTRKITENTRAREVCQTMQSDRVEYGTLDAAHYLQLLSESRPVAQIKFKENLPKQIHPWRRFFARSLDYGFLTLLVNFFLVVVLRIRPIPDGIWAVIIDLACGAAMIPLEAWMIHKFGTTPGKWLCGIRLEWIQGGLLPWDNAWTRALGVWRSGMGFCIPYVRILVNGTCYRTLTGRARRLQLYNEVSPPRDMDWDDESETELIYEPVEGKRRVVLLAVLALYAALIGVVALDSVKPKYQGAELTVAQFAKNYNATYDLLNEEYDWSQLLREDGTWNPQSNSVVTVHVGSEPVGDRQNLKFEEQNGIVSSITYTQSWTEVFYLQPVGSVCRNIIATLFLGQEDMTLAKFEKAMKDLEYELEQHSTGSYRYGDIEVVWDVQYENCKFLKGLLTDFAESNQVPQTNGTASMTFSVILH